MLPRPTAQPFPPRPSRLDFPFSTRPAPFRSVLVLSGFLIAAFAAAALGAVATANGVKDWYPEIAKPAWTPPSWLFGPVWTVLYIAMAVVAWRVWSLPPVAPAAPKESAAFALPAQPLRSVLLGAWWLQLALNASWSWAFFHFRNPAAGMLVIGALLLVIGWMQPRLAAADRPSALLWTPYVLWVAFASCLNLAIWHLN